ncbi:hypothetical protein Cob_v011787 [Colletotrichum orbiculare MAFF 240422]|uniref:Uncharacterized protein n=1 Tax=Colletotrichum orbiculare (strain 104-T / ATCC 96160 / CBS 514.97 / LARS 414 / MAFF 240422) TaxID=1213857 RepID=A0A484FBF9_COLOR|nr:hypothetical protein Cob_v011787 [Colletotrichum orbiculare MAFF 240422]
MLKLAVAFLMGLTVVTGIEDPRNSPMYCDYGTSQVPQQSCRDGQYVYCCVSASRVNDEPYLLEGFPIPRGCSAFTGACTVTNGNGTTLKNEGGGDVIGLGSCC